MYFKIFITLQQTTHRMFEMIICFRNETMPYPIRHFDNVFMTLNWERSHRVYNLIDKSSEKRLNEGLVTYERVLKNALDK